MKPVVLFHYGLLYTALFSLATLIIFSKSVACQADFHLRSLPDSTITISIKVIHHWLSNVPLRGTLEKPHSSISKQQGFVYHWILIFCLLPYRGEILSSDNSTHYIFATNLSVEIISRALTSYTIASVFHANVEWGQEIIVCCPFSLRLPVWC